MLLILMKLIAYDFQFEFLIAMVLIVIKVIIAQLLPLQVSYFNNSKYDKNMEFLEEHFNNRGQVSKNSSTKQLSGNYGV
jgi:hypothetical protein